MSEVEDLSVQYGEDGSATWTPSRATGKPFVVRVFGLPNEKLFAVDGGEKIAECTDGMNKEAELRPGTYNAVGGDMRVTYLHTIAIGEDGSVKETREFHSDALRSNMFAGDLAKHMQ